MKREEFLKELENLLQDISENERAEAMQYYRDYFDDAGPENEAQIIEELGSPERVAYTIKADLGEADGQFTERGYEDDRFADRQEVGHRVSQEKQHDSQSRELQKAAKKSANGWKIACIILLCILLFPILFPLSIAVLAVIAAVVITIVAVAVAIGAAALGLLVAGVAVVVVGIGKALLMPAAGLALAGTGLLLLAVGILATVAIVWCCVKFLPWLIRGVVKLIQYPFRRRKEA